MSGLFVIKIPFFSEKYLFLNESSTSFFKILLIFASIKTSIKINQT